MPNLLKVKTHRARHLSMLSKLQMFNIPYTCRLCRFVSELTIGGDKVTDEGMRNLVGHLDLDPIPDDDEDDSDGGSKSNDFSPADICSSLTHLKLVRDQLYENRSSRKTDSQ